MTHSSFGGVLTVPPSCVFLNIDPERQWIIRQTASKVVKIVKGFIEESLSEVDVRYSKVSVLVRRARVWWWLKFFNFFRAVSSDMLSTL